MKKLLSIALCCIIAVSANAKKKATIEESMQLYQQAVELYNARDYAAAAPIMEESLNIRAEAAGKENAAYIKQLGNLARCRSNMHDLEGAIATETEALRLISIVYGNDNLEYAASLSDLALYNSRLGKYDEAVKLASLAKSVRQNVLSQEIPNYATLLGNLAKYSYNIKDNAAALGYANEAADVRRRFDGENGVPYAKSLADLAEYHHHAGKHADAIASQKAAAEIYRTHTAEYPEAYGNAMSRLAAYHAAAKQYQAAIDAERVALQEREHTGGNASSQYASSLSNLALYNSMSGNYDEAISLGKQSLAVGEKGSRDYAVNLDRIASYNASAGNYSEALRYENEAVELLKSLDGGSPSHGYATSLSNLALYNAAVGNYDEHIRLETEALAIRAQSESRESAAYASSLNALATSNFILGRRDEAIRLGTEALDIRRRIFGENHPEYAIALSNLSIYRFESGERQQASAMASDAMRRIEASAGKSHPYYATALNNLAAYRYYADSISDAITLNREALALRHETLGEQHPDYAVSLCNLANLYSETSDVANLSQCALKATALKTRFLTSTFSDLTTAERNLYWQRNRRWFTADLQQYAHDFPTDSLISNGYNAILLAKGVLLNSEMEISRLLLQSGDPTLADDYRRLQADRMILNRQYEKPVARRELSTDSLSRAIADLERSLISRSKAYGDYTRRLSVTWPQVASALSEGEMAVEFVAYPIDDDASSSRYIAYVLRHGMTRPAMVPICLSSQLDAIPAASLYTTPDAARLIWQPLDSLMAGVETVYFSPDGQLYNIAIESLPAYDGNGMTDDSRRLHRLSSTRLLASRREPRASTRATLYGGMQYSMSPDEMQVDGQRYRTAASMRHRASRSLLDSINRRCASSLYLPASLTEVNEISSTLSASGIATTTLTGTEGTETSFKALSGQAGDIAHIATHGFYWSPDDMRAPSRLKFLQLDNQAPSYTEDKALTRSGLLFAGAENALRGHETPDGADDGVLTAKEISMLDLRSLDLVVLSACQTGLGEITSDGVLGLQRGFKKAGAGALMMSLWKVDDDATRLFMSRFYASLTSGVPRHDAMRDARNHLRRYTAPDGSTPYAAPSYWAAFILLDSLD